MIDTALLDTLAADRAVVVGPNRSAGSRGRFDVVDPATGTVLAAVSDGGTDDAVRAVDAAAAAGPGWAATPARVRG